MRSSSSYALTGILLGLGAPLGSWILRTLISGHSPNVVWVNEWQSATYYYLYMTLGTTTAFGLFGFVLGRRNEDLSQLSVTDGLTGLYNHRHLQEMLKQEIQRSDRYRFPLTCLMIDIDNFKKVNDQYGHQFGDETLRTIAELIQKKVRRIDIVGRYGGEEFLVIMPQTHSAAARPLADRIGKTVAHHVFLTNAKQRMQITLSIGVATYPDPGQGVKTQSGLLSAADQAMYKAKLSGKNQTVVWRS